MAWVISGLTTTATKTVPVCMFAGLLQTPVCSCIIFGTLQRHNFAASTAGEMDLLSPASDRQMPDSQRLRTNSNNQSIYKAQNRVRIDYKRTRTHAHTHTRAHAPASIYKAQNRVRIDYKRTRTHAHTHTRAHAPANTSILTIPRYSNRAANSNL